MKPFENGTSTKYRFCYLHVEIKDILENLWTLSKRPIVNKWYQNHTEPLTEAENVTMV